MLRPSAIGVLVFLAWARCASPANPSDIEFLIRLVNDSHAFHIGEPIQLEASYYSEAEKKYWATYTSYEGGITPHVTPSAGVLDLEAWRRDDSRPIAASILSSGDFVNSHPFWEKFDLGHWYRFQEPGHYSLTISSSRVSRVKSAEEGGGFENITLESDPVEFDILPPDPSWDAAELENIQQILTAPDVNGSQQPALQRLVYLDTPASVQALLHIYLSHADSSGWIVENGLFESSQTDQIIQALLAALSNPTTDPPNGMQDIVARLQVRKGLGIQPARPSDPNEEEGWKSQLKARSEAYDKYVAQNDALLLASVARRTGTVRASAVYSSWNSAERKNDENSPPPESLVRLRQNVLDVANDLNPSQMLDFVNLGWHTIPHDQLLPIILILTKDGPEKNSAYREGAFHFWCEGWPTDCDAAILRSVSTPNSKLDLSTLLLLPESEHPELDGILKSRMKDPGFLRGSGPAQLDAALIMRVGSRNLVPDVNALLDQMGQQQTYACRIDAYFFGYLFRFDPAVGSKRLTAELHDPKNDCVLETLQTLNEMRYSDSLLPSVRNSIDSPNFLAAGAAAVFLGLHGRPSDADVIRKRLDAFWSVWRDRSAELQGVLPYHASPESQAADLEQSLASALSHATNWTLSPAELERLREGCITERCREIADNKMSLGL